MKKFSNYSFTFGAYIRDLRIKNEIGQRELAKKVGLAASYLTRPLLTSLLITNPHVYALER